MRDRFGVPDQVWDDGGGSRTLEYNRQPAGLRNYMITIGPDGKMSALRQVLTPENFARIIPGMGMDEVRRRLGKPAKVTPLALQNENAPRLAFFGTHRIRRWCLRWWRIGNCGCCVRRLGLIQALNRGGVVRDDAHRYR